MSRRADYGVAVIGGGPAGMAAALAAAGCGADVLLVERAGSLGGNVSQALVHTICGLYLPAEERDVPAAGSLPTGLPLETSPAQDSAQGQAARPSRVPRHAHHGVPRAFAETLERCGATGGVEWSGQAAFLPIDPGAFAAEARRLCDGSGRIERRNGAALTRLLLTGDGAELEIERAAQGSERATAESSAVRARFVVDTTGDANAATLAGVATEGARPDEIQHASCIFRLDDVDTETCNAMERARATMLVARAARQGRLPSTASSVVVRAGARKGSLYVTLNLPKPAGLAFDPLSAVALDEALRAALADAEAVAAFLTGEREAFAGARVGEWPRRIGVRETRRVRGLVRLEEADVLGGRRRDDEACVSTWPVELWQRHDRLTFRPVAGPSSVPLGCLVADHPSRRLAVAGRCVSASREALGALRVIGTSMAMGEAAGAAAALALAGSGDLAGVDPAAVRGAVASGRTTSAW